MLAELKGSAQAEQRADALRASFLAARGERASASALIDKVKAGRYVDHHVAIAWVRRTRVSANPRKRFDGCRKPRERAFCVMDGMRAIRFSNHSKPPKFDSWLASVRATAARIAQAYRRPT